MPNLKCGVLVAGLLLAVIIGLGLRCPELGVRPMHNDESINAIKFRDLYERGLYKYDPFEYHGPTLPYLTLVWAKLTRVPAFVDFSEARFRALNVLFGIALILLLPLVADGLGRKATICAAVLTAISPAMVFYSRYYIHEMLLVCFSFLALAGGWRYFRSRKLGWAILMGVALGLMQATKETFVLSVAAGVGAVLLTGYFGHVVERREPWLGVPSTERGRASLLGELRTLKPAHILALFLVWAGVAPLFFTSFFTNPAGPLDSIRTYMPWLHRTAGASPHIHPWYFYLERLAYFHARNGPIFTEALILVLAVVGAVAAFTRGNQSDDPHPAFLRFLVFYTLLLTLIYSVLAYKTPWCALGFLHGFILLAGAGAAALFQWASQKWLWLSLILALLLLAAAQLADQARRAATTFCADQANPWVYAQTSPDLLHLVDEVEAIAKSSPQGHHLLLKVMAPDGGYWPLPWYLRRFDQVGWWSEIPSDPYAPVMIVSAQFKAALDEKKTHVMAGYFKLRPDVFLELYVQLDVWQAYLQTRPKPPD